MIRLILLLTITLFSLPLFSQTQFVDSGFTSAGLEGISILTENTQIVMSTWSEKSIHLYGELPEEYSLKMEEQQAQLIIRVAPASQAIENAGELTIRLPENMEIFIVSNSGDIRMENNAVSVKAQSVSGDILIESPFVDHLDLHTLSGEIMIFSGQSVNVSASSLSGTIYQRLQSVRNVNTTTVSGAIELKLGQLIENPNITLNTLDGRIRVSFMEKHSPLIPSPYANTDTNRKNVNPLSRRLVIRNEYYLQNDNVSLDFSTLSGRITIDFYKE